MMDMELMATALFVATPCFLFYLLCVRRYKQTFGVKVVKEEDYDFQYISRTVKLPPVRGFVLRFATKLINSFFGHFALVGRVASEGGFDKFRSLKLHDSPTFHPFVDFDEMRAKPDERDESCSDQVLEKLLHSDDDIRSQDNFSFHSVSSYVSQYRNGKLTPSEVAERLLVGIQSTADLRAVIKYKAKAIREMAAASTKRYESKSTLSLIDGVFVIIKDEFAVKGFSLSNGTPFMGREGPATYSSDLVQKLEDLGAIIVGVSNMHELGLGTTGNNSNKGFGSCRNPYNINHYPGGSSSGSAASVAAGLCCMGLGTDGGGSIRIPASYCGVVGLKATFARFSLARMPELTYTVGHGGPICANVKDAALFYALLAGPSLDFELGLNQPRVKLPNFDGNLEGIKMAIDRRFFNDCDGDVLRICNKSLDMLTDSGVQLDDIEVPELHLILLAHRVIIICEMSTGINYDFEVNYEEISHPSRIFFKVGSTLTAVDYLQANKQRTRAMRFFKQLFKKVDIFVTPTAAHCAPKIVPSELASGMLNGQQDTKNMRFANLANLIGCPAITIPVGYNENGLPVGLQIMSAWWREDVILKVAERIERQIQKRKPKLFADLLEA